MRTKASARILTIMPAVSPELSERKWIDVDSDGGEVCITRYTVEQTVKAIQKWMVTRTETSGKYSKLSATFQG